MSGNPVWNRDLGTFSSQHGAGASPIVYGDKVFLAYDQDPSSVLLALRSGTGEVLWQTSRQAFVACYSSPFILETPGDKAQLIVASTAGISGYDPEAGRILWNWPWVFHGKPLRTVASPVFADGFVFANSGDGGGDRHTVAIQLSGKGASTQARLVWESTRTFPYVPTMLTWEGHLYWVSDLGIAACHELRTGKNIWTERLGGNFTASPVLIGGKIYAVNEDGDTFVFAASPAFKLLAKNSIGELVRATPAAANNRLFIRGQNHLFCIARPGE
jgi:outer membrane protein assembly factor BamB